MIIYQKQTPVDCTDTIGVGVTGDNLANSVQFYIRDITEALSYTVHLRFADGSVNSVIPSNTEINGDGTKITWKIKKNDIFSHGFFDVQLEGRNKNGVVIQTEIVQLYANESLAIEDKTYENPNSETLLLRDEAYSILQEISEQQSVVEKNLEEIQKTNIALKEDKLNKVSDTRYVTDVKNNYPSISYVRSYYYDFETVDELLDEKADRAETLEGYGIQDAYNKRDMDSALNSKQNYYGMDDAPKKGSIALMTSNAIFKTLNDTGTGSLNVYTASAIPIIKSATYEYYKIGKFMQIFVNIQFNEGSSSYFQLTGMPGNANATSTQCRIIVPTSKNNTNAIVYPVGAWLTVTGGGKTINFAQDEELRFTITEITK